MRYRRLHVTLTVFLLSLALTAVPVLGATLSIVTTSTPDIYIDLIEKFREAHPDIEVIHSTESLNAWPEKLSILLATGLAPDVFELSWAFYGEFAQQGVLMDMGPFLERDWELIDGDDIVPAAWLASQFQGRQVTIPSRPGHTMMFYNLDVLEAAGLPAPDSNWTWDTYVELARKATNVDEGIYGAHNLHYWGLWSSVLFSYGGGLWSPDETRITINSEAGRKTFTFLRELVHDHRAAPYPGTVPSNLWDVGKQVFNYGGSSLWLNTQRAASFRFGAVHYPSGPEGRYNTGGMIVFAANANTEVPEEAWTFMKFMMSPEIQLYRAQFGEIPIRTSVFRELDEDHMRVFAEGLAYMRPYTSRYHSQINPVVTQAVNAILRGDITVEAALESLEIQLNAIAGLTP